MHHMCDDNMCDDDLYYTMICILFLICYFTTFFSFMLATRF